MSTGMAFRMGPCCHPEAFNCLPCFLLATQQEKKVFYSNSIRILPFVHHQFIKKIINLNSNTSFNRFLLLFVAKK